MAAAGGSRGEAGVWLHASDPALAPALRVLAAQIEGLPGAPLTKVTGDAEAPGPGDEPRSIDAVFEYFPTALLVLAGDALPVPIIDRARARGVALMLVDAANPAPAGRWRLLGGGARAALSKFSEIHARDPEAAALITRNVRGAVPVHATGMLARHAPVRACNEQELDALHDSLGARPVWLAQDVPEDEADAVFLAHSHALRRAHRLLLIVSPRDAAQGAAFAARAAEAGFVCALRSSDEEIDETTQVYVADAGDDPGLFLRLAPVTYLGGSLTRGAGSASPETAAALGSALVFGPWGAPGERRLLERLRQAGGGREIGAPGDLGTAISAMLSPEVGADMALKAWTLATEGADATWAVARAIRDWMGLNGVSA